MAKDLSLYPHRQDPGTLLLDKVIHEFLNRLRFQEALLCAQPAAGCVLAWPGAWDSHALLLGFPQLCLQLLKLAGQRACQAALGGRAGGLPTRGTLPLPAPPPPKMPLPEALQTCSVSSPWWVVKVWGGAA